MATSLRPGETERTQQAFPGAGVSRQIAQKTAVMYDYNADNEAILGKSKAQYAAHDRRIRPMEMAA